MTVSETLQDDQRARRAQLANRYCGHNTDDLGFIFKLIVDMDSMSYKFPE